ncbi:hypothetical protein G6F46_006480 [Rhizopus delemar]|uniref:GATA-type domain-containing protein n=2 Tax=Rhizopus TaxID=4842 RepID=A0A9P7CLD8_9FUNG|nr:hypothetical protein G6F43_010593 [Rhizopus delemar]KAG1543546.1 hypothetical protein G6F51_006602 [Rhizopus arrhizus]KAG1450953.1 hypothetical protein G6F55_009429 [Rhizopus delemar]KAG1491747.1 hypothetical protein G6F54_009793 [Rhizopus delemar]KAG1509111.1 hypothetical protein G6F53_007691 [Rhizopus delemar]
MSETKSCKKSNSEVSATVCSNCGTTTTPLWRRAPNGDIICNACGLYLKARHTLRPVSMKRSVKKAENTALPGTCPGDGQCNGTGGSASCKGCPAFNQNQVAKHPLICANCRTTTTPLWRRDESGNTICNACGLYYKLHHVHRPVSMKRSVIKRRKRIVVSEQGEEQEIEEESSDEEVQLKNKRKKVIKSTLLSVPSSSSSPVPPIEDYIEPKRSPLRSLPSSPPSSTSHPHARLPPPPRTPPSFNRTLPSIPDIRNHPRFDPIFDYRSTPQKHLPTHSRGYEDLIEFDDAMTRLERIRRRVPSEQHRTLSSLTNALQKIVIEAENILYNK